MRRPRSVLVFFLLFMFGVCLAVPAEDVPETPYGESEALPYESTPLFSIAMPQASARIAKAEFSRDSQLCFNSSAKRGMHRREKNALPGCFPPSLTILNHSFRC
jgi:hypothetical protein